MALCKNTTYQQIEDIVRLRTDTIGDMQISQSLMIKEICFAVQKWAKVLNGATAPMYTQTNDSLTIAAGDTTGLYTVDLSGLNPFIDKIIRVVHRKADNTRTLVNLLTPREAEKVTSLTTLYSTSIFGVNEGESIKLYAGSSFTVTTATDTIELVFYRQPTVSTAVTPTVVYDAAFTVAADGITVSAVTGVLAAHVGGMFVGTDYGGLLFSKIISGYISSTSFVLSSAVTAGAGTLGYIIPPASALVGTGAYPDIPDSYIPTVIDEVVSKIQMYKNKGQADQGLQASLERERQSILTAYGMTKQETSKGE